MKELLGSRQFMFSSGTFLIVLVICLFVALLAVGQLRSLAPLCSFVMAIFAVCGTFLGCVSVAWVVWWAKQRGDARKDAYNANPVAARRSRYMAWCCVIASALLLLTIIIIFSFYMHWQSSLPSTAGTLHIAGLNSDVTVDREPGGTIHIRADSERDLFFTQGYVTAQERLWQLEFQRRLAAGRLAEVVGEPGLKMDKMFRSLGVYTAAQSAVNSLPTDGREVLQAYVDGVNAFLVW
jgi:hypothetical protein